jgi:hypothetical protein
MLVEVSNKVINSRFLFTGEPVLGSNGSDRSTPLSCLGWDEYKNGEEN